MVKGIVEKGTENSNRQWPICGLFRGKCCNGGSVADLKAQVTFFRTHYKVMAMHSRDQGRSGDSSGPINYQMMTSDFGALLDYLHIGPANVLGWSDGAIEALELGMNYPGKVKKIAAMAANLEPDGAVPEFVTPGQTDDRHHSRLS